MNAPTLLERLETFVWLVRQTREQQREYRRTIDARLRYSVAKLERLLDADAEQLAAELAAEIRGATPTPEGGVA